MIEVNLEKKVNKYANILIDKIFADEMISYAISIENNLREGLSFKKSFNDLEKHIKQQIQDTIIDLSHKELIDCFQKIEKDYATDSFNKAAYSNAFQSELESKHKTLNEFIDYYGKYLAYNEVLKFHYQNKAIFKRYFKIKYDDKLKNEVGYYDLKLCKGNPENDSITINEWTRLEDILNPPKKRIVDRKLQKYGIDLTTKDIAVFMILFKAYYKISFNSYVEFVALSRLIFDDLHFNIKANDAKQGTSIDRYLNGKELFSSKFNFDTSKEKVIAIVSETNLRDFKKYVKKVKIDKFEKLLS